MFTSFLSLFDRTRASFAASSQAKRTAHRPVVCGMIEALEGRQLLSASLLQAPITSTAPAAAVTQQLASVGKLAQKGITNVLPLSIVSIVNQGGQLVANALLGGHAFQIPLDLSASPAAPGATPVLNLHIGAIHLDLLGLKVDTSPICLDITAQPGSGNLLGNLVTSIANLLNGGGTLGGILGGLSGTQLNTLLTGLTNVLNNVLGQITAPGAVTGVGGISPGASNILHLSLGPVNLDLLGLNVDLDNCSNGPITVDITAQEGNGQLLGNLLGGLSRLLDNGASNVAVANALARIANALHGLL
jgi:hypothetical protein